MSSRRAESDTPWNSSGHGDTLAFVEKGERQMRSTNTIVPTRLRERVRERRDAVDARADS
jgi:hypothetical protein